MAKLLINPASGGTSDYYGTFGILNNLVTGNVVNGLNVTQASSPNMTVLVQPGTGIIREGTAPGQIGYHALVDTSAGESVTIATANGSNPRIDYVVGYVNKSATPTGTNNTNVLLFASVAGTPAATPAVPTVSQIQTAIGAANPYTILCKIAVGTSVTSIVNANITDLRSMATSNAIVPSSNLTNPYKFSAYRNASWTTPASTFGLVTLDTVIFDTSSNYSTSTGKFTVPVSGFYYLNASFNCIGSAGGTNLIAADLFKNGSELKRGNQFFAAAAAVSFGATVSGLVQLTAGDYIQFYVYTQGALTGSTGPGATYFEGFLVSAT